MEGVILRVPTYRAARAPPLFEAGAVEDVLAEDGKEACGLIHALETDGAGRELDEGRGRWWDGFRGQR